MWIRVKAFAADYLVVSLYIILLTGISLIVQPVSPDLMQTMFGNPWVGQITGFFTMTVPVTLYFALFESSSYQATWGKRWQGIKVIYNDGKQLSRIRAIGRTALKFIPWELAHTCIWQMQFNSQKLSPIILTGLVLVWVLAGIYVLTLLTNPQKQALYDQLTNTYVVPG